MSPDFDSAIKLLLLFFERKKGSIVYDACKECYKKWAFAEKVISAR